MIYGHSTGWGADVDLYSYAEFDSIDRDDKFRLMDISARNSNRDGAALRFVAEQLSKRPDIRFDIADYYGGLHCGECMDVFTGGKWKPTRIEYGDNWYLVGIRAEDLNGLRVRI